MTRTSKYFTFVDGNNGKIKAFVVSKGKGTFIRLPTSWMEKNKQIYITFQDNTEIKTRIDTINGYPIANVPAVYAHQYVCAQTFDEYE